MKKIFIATFLLSLFLIISAQTTEKKCNCCTEKQRQFDFWIGEWDVFDTTGIKIGENNILAIQDSCVIQENWVSANLTGTSYNYYNPDDSTWNQVWIDNTGAVLVLKGRFSSGKMILRSSLSRGVKGKLSYNRISWEKNIDASVTQTWEVLDEKDHIINLAFKGIYKPFIKTSNMESKGRATGIGGIFFKCKDPEKMKAWYQEHLGLKTDKYGTSFEWRLATDPAKKGFTQWSPFSETTKYFEPSTKDFMLNYRVENMDLLLDQLKKEGVTILDTVETYDYGKFVHIADPEGNKIELWEPNDIEYDKFPGGRTK